jgi:hypothetical protein
MRRHFLCLLLGATALAAPPLPFQEEALVAARRAALGLAGAWANDGFKTRDTYWNGRFEAGRPEVVPVSLFAGNQYWFSAAAPGGGPLRVTVHDDAGRPVAGELYEDGARAAAGFAPDVTGTYFVKLEQSGNQPVVFCLIYSYK